MRTQMCTMFLYCVLLALVLPTRVVSQYETLTIDVGKTIHPVSPTLFGIFFEEINHAGVGGLYAEQVQNRAFHSGAVATPPLTPTRPRTLTPTPTHARTPTHMVINEYDTQRVSKEEGEGVMVGVGASELASFSPATEDFVYIRHCNYYAWASHVMSDLDMADSTFYVRQGLADPTGISLESFNYPGQFLRHYNFRIMLNKNDNSTLFANDATFKVVKGLFESSMISLQSVNYPNYYIAIGPDDGNCSNIQDKSALYLRANDGSAAFKLNATFTQQPPNYNALQGWSVIQEGGAQTTASLDYSTPLNNVSTVSAKIVATNYTSGVSYGGIANEGYWGVAIKPGTYSLSLFAKGDVSFKGSLLIFLESLDGKNVYAKATINSLTTTFQKYTASMVVGSNVKPLVGRLSIRLTSAGTVWVDVVSLFPQTYKNRENGMRVDLANLVANLQPKFFRFPGGCYIEGNTLQNGFLWKETIGPIEMRPGHFGFWGYWSDDGLGYLEYLQFSEDIGAEPIYVANAGIAMNEYANTTQEIQSWIQDALDAIEFANGDASRTQWGKLRAQYGHPAPFNMKFLAIGNENGCGFDKFHIYVSHYDVFAKAIRAQYPNITLIANCDISQSVGNVDAFDYHVYQSPSWFLQNVNIFNNQPRNGPKVFVSEYAVTVDCGQGNLNAALAEAAWMTGLIRNSDIVTLASYAPLFVNVNDRTWNPDAIVFDALSSYGTPSYYVQQLFAKYTGNSYLSSTFSSNNTNYATVATMTSSTHKLYVAVINYSSSSLGINVSIKNAPGTLKSTATSYTLTSSGLSDENSLSNPTKIAPVTNQVTGISAQFSRQFVSYSVTILEISLA